MDQDLYTAVKMLASQLDLNSEAAEELLSILDLTEKEPEKSVLYSKNCSFSFEAECAGGAKRFWLNGKRVYQYTFFFVVVETLAGRRIIVEILPTTTEDL